MRIQPILFWAMITSASSSAQRSTSTSAKDSLPPKTTYTYVEVMPKFKGDIYADVLKKLRIPEPCMEMTPGRVVATFTVEANGLLSELQIARSSGCAQLDSEIVRLLIPMTRVPQWIPGKQKGQAAAIKYAMPVNIHLD